MRFFMAGLGFHSDGGDFLRLSLGFRGDGGDATEGVGGVFVGADGDGVDAHLDDGIVVAAWLGHVAEVEDFVGLDLEFFEEVGHAELFVHAWGNSVDGGGAADFVIEFRGEFLAAGDDLFALLTVGIPGVFGFGAGVLAEGGEGDLAEAVFDDFVTVGKLVGFPVAEFAGGLFDGGGDFRDLFRGQGVVVDLVPFRGGEVVAIVLGALSDEEVEMGEFFRGGLRETIDDLDEELVEFLAGDGADFVGAEEFG